jgi:small subunit ribosomal protein S20
MPITRSAARQLRKDRARRLRNQTVSSELKTLKKQFLTLVAARKHPEAAQALSLVMRRFDRAAAKRVIHKGTASRTASRLTRQLARIAPAATA